jgi:16S rRNA C967 or C1407 C5-methylase (RsmB/RsmF family)
MMIPRELLKKNLGLKQIHQLVISLADSGLITRQEIVSMLPPLLLDVQSHHAVFDMCAAPGSKTAQMLELQMADHILKTGGNETRPSGFVIANDADPKRAFMLTHQINRLNSGNIVITNHLA